MRYHQGLLDGNVFEPSAPQTALLFFLSPEQQEQPGPWAPFCFCTFIRKLSFMRTLFDDIPQLGQSHGLLYCHIGLVSEPPPYISHS